MVQGIVMKDLRDNLFCMDIVRPSLQNLLWARRSRRRNRPSIGDTSEKAPGLPQQDSYSKYIPVQLDVHISQCAGWAFMLQEKSMLSPRHVSSSPCFSSRHIPSIPKGVRTLGNCAKGPLHRVCLQRWPADGKFGKLVQPIQPVQIWITHDGSRNVGPQGAASTVKWEPVNAHWTVRKPKLETLKTQVLQPLYSSPLLKSYFQNQHANWGPNSEAACAQSSLR
jgi:hypothetical protein